MTAERDVLKACMDYLATIPNSRWYRRNVGAARLTGGYHVRFNKRGMADIWGVWNGVHVEIEIKRPGKKPSDDQEAWLHDCQSVGALALWVDNVDDLIAEMERRKS